MFGKDFEHLRLDQAQAESIKHEQSYIKSGTGPSGVRNIFNNQPLDDFEKQKLKELTQALTDASVPKNRIFGETGKLLKFLYSYSFSIPDTVNAIIRYIKWFDSPSNYELTPLSRSVLEKGWVYLMGRDKYLRPVICFNYYLMNTQVVPVEEICKAICYLLLVAEEYMFYPGYVENWIAIVEVNKMGAQDCPISLIKRLAEILQEYFPQNLYRMFLVNVPTVLQYAYTAIKTVIKERTRQKINVDASDYQLKLLSYIDDDQLEERFGGRLQQPAVYFPPYLTHSIFIGDKSLHKYPKQRIFDQEDTKSLSVHNQKRLTQDDGKNYQSGLPPTGKSPSTYKEGLKTQPPANTYNNAYQPQNQRRSQPQQQEFLLPNTQDRILYTSQPYYANANDQQPYRHTQDGTYPNERPYLKQERGGSQRIFDPNYDDYDQGIIYRNQKPYQKEQVFSTPGQGAVGFQQPQRDQQKVNGQAPQQQVLQNSNEQPPAQPQKPKFDLSSETFEENVEERKQLQEQPIAACAIF